MANLTQKDVDDILRLIDNSHFDEIKLEIGDLKLEVRRRGAARPASMTIHAESAEAGSGVVHAPAKPPLNGAKANGSAIRSSAEPGIDVTAPLLGTFYHAPKPGADAFVQVGDVIAADTVIGIIEVMKLMNSVPAGIGGIVTEIVAPNGELVEHGQALIRVRPA